MEAFFRLAQVLPLSQAVLDQAVTLRQQRNMSLGDALVAGTALVHGLTLVTRNVEDFQWIQGLSLLNPFDTYRASTRARAAGVSRRQVLPGGSGERVSQASPGPASNKGMELTAYSVRYAPASSRSSYPAFGTRISRNSQKVLYVRLCFMYTSGARWFPLRPSAK